MSHLGHSSHSAASDGSASALKSVRKLAIAGFLQIVLVHFQRPSSSIQEVRLHSSFVEDEDGDLISPVQMSVEFTTSFP